MVRPVLNVGLLSRSFLRRRPSIAAVQRFFPITRPDNVLKISGLNCYGARLSTTGFTEKSFSRITNRLTNRKLEYSERKVLRYPVDLMYDIVQDVDKYCEFVPWCKKSQVLIDKGKIKRAKLEVGFTKVNEKYNSTVTCIKPHLVKAVCTDGVLFNSLVCIWRFAPGKNPPSCVIDFQVSFEFRSLIYTQLANMVFNEIVKTMIDAFEKRASEIQKTAKVKVVTAVNNENDAP